MPPVSTSANYTMDVFTLVLFFNVALSAVMFLFLGTDITDLKTTLKRCFFLPDTVIHGCCQWMSQCLTPKTCNRCRKLAVATQRFLFFHVTVFSSFYNVTSPYISKNPRFQISVPYVNINFKHFKLCFILRTN